MLQFNQASFPINRERFQLILNSLIVFLTSHCYFTLQSEIFNQAYFSTFWRFSWTQITKLSSVQNTGTDCFWWFFNSWCGSSDLRYCGCVTQSDQVLTDTSLLTGLLIAFTSSPITSGQWTDDLLCDYQLCCFWEQFFEFLMFKIDVNLFFTEQFSKSASKIVKAASEQIMKQRTS